MTDERFHGQGDQGEPLAMPGSEERTYVLRGNLPPNTWKTLVKQLGYAFDISLEPVDTNQAGPEDGEVKAEQGVILNRDDFDKFALENGYTTKLAGRAWGVLATIYHKKVNSAEYVNFWQRSGQNPEDYPLSFAGPKEKQYSAANYYGFEIEGLAQILSRIDGQIGEHTSKSAKNRIVDNIFMFLSVGEKTLEFYRALVEHYMPEEDQPDQPQS